MILFAKFLATYTFTILFFCVLGIFAAKDVKSIKTSVLSLLANTPYLVFFILYLNGG